MMTRRWPLSMDDFDHIGVRTPPLKITAMSDTRITSWQLVPCQVLLDLGHIMCYLRVHLVFDLGPLRLVVENCLRRE